MYQQISRELNKLKNPSKAKVLQRFFKTGPGEYGYGDKFLGIVVPIQRQVAKKYYQTTTLVDVKKLLHSQWHEYRLVGLLLLTYKFPSSNDIEKKQIYNFYLKNTKYINNWDLVDLSADKIVGAYLFTKKMGRTKASYFRSDIVSLVTTSKTMDSTNSGHNTNGTYARKYRI